MARLRAGHRHKRGGGLGRRLGEISELCGAAALFVMLALTCADVFGRYLLASPVNGAPELTRFLMAGLIAFALPVVTARGEHITIDLFDDAFRGRAKLVRDLAVDGTCAAALLVLAWWVGFRALRLRDYGYVSDFLHVPLYPVAFFVAAMIALSGIALALKSAAGLLERPATG